MFVTSIKYRDKEDELDTEIELVDGELIITQRESERIHGKVEKHTIHIKADKLTDFIHTIAEIAGHINVDFN